MEKYYKYSSPSDEITVATAITDNMILTAIVPYIRTPDNFLTTINVARLKGDGQDLKKEIELLSATTEYIKDTHEVTFKDFLSVIKDDIDIINNLIDIKISDIETECKNKQVLNTDYYPKEDNTVYDMINDIWGK